MSLARSPTSYVRPHPRGSVTRVALAALLTGCLDRPVGLTHPSTTDVFVRAVPHHTLDKLDLLFMVDNSMSMVDKQQILSQAVPVLLQRLATPNCVDDMGRPNGEVTDAQGSCAHGKPQLRAVKDIHVGVITSSLGAHGGVECDVQKGGGSSTRTTDDRAELLPSANPAVRGALPSWNGSGFLAWDPGQNKNSPPGQGNLDKLIADFADLVVATGELGCGFEGQLEAWYRFLVDPEPPLAVSSAFDPNANAIVSTKGPVNETILAQRKAFLRPDSLVAVVMLTDENDCSITDEDGSQGWLATTVSTRLPRASSACQNPEDPCCHSCAAPAPQGCLPNDADPECSKKDPTDDYAKLGLDEDQPNARCFDQRRRFGLDLLYPVERYIDGLSAQKVANRKGELVPNPLFVAPPGTPARDPSHVLLAGIVGVPWQDISTEESWNGASLEFMNADELEKNGRWDVVLGPKGGLASDPLMREAFAPRSGEHPLLHVPVAPPSSTDPHENPINGHEQNVAHGDDLQYACTFDLPMARACDDQNAASCDCNADEQSNNRPLCNYPGGPGTNGNQIAAKAYPGLRELAVLRGVGENAIVASICPKHTAAAAGLSRAADPAYGYNPAVQAILEVFTDRFGGQCLPRQLPVERDPMDPDFGQVPCAVVEATRKNGEACGCDTGHGREPLGPADDKLPAAVTGELALTGQCGGSTGVDCHDYCFCKLRALTGVEQAACQAGSEDPNLYGYCYVDPGLGIGAASLVSGCQPSERRMLRYMGEGVPANGAVLYTACLGATFEP